MSEPFDNEEDQEEEHFDDLEAENEFKKLKLALEHGMDLSKPLSESGLPPEIEGQFLDYVQQWEDEMAKGNMILIYDLIGKPDFKKEGELDEAEISAELERIMGMLHANSLHLDTISEVTDRELYRFITEELFNKETNDIKIEGMMHCYIYEEYHPNNEHDIKSRCRELIEHITDKEEDKDQEPWSLEDIISCAGKDFTREELNQKLILFRDSFSSFTVHELEFTTIHINEAITLADVIAHIHYSGVIDGSHETIDFEGECRFSLKREEEWWVIDSFEVPGVMV